MMKGEEEFKKELAEFIVKLLNIVPPYDTISHRIMGLKRIYYPSTEDLAFIFPEISIENLSLLQKLFGMDLRSNGIVNTSTGSYLISRVEELRNSIYNLFDDDSFRTKISKYIGKEIPNPSKVFVENAFEAINKHEKRKELLEIMKIMASHSRISVNDILTIFSERGIVMIKEEIEELLRILTHLGLVENWTVSHYRILDVLRRHISGKLVESP